MHINLSFKNIKLFQAVWLVLIISAFSMTAAAQTPCGETDYDCQITQATRAIQTNPNDVSGYARRGDAYYNKGSYELSIKDYSKVLELNPKNARIFSYRADAYNKLEKDNLAISDYTKSLALDPNNSVTYLHRANSYYFSGNFESAIKDYNKAIAIEPDDYKAYYNRGVALYTNGYNQQAIADFQKALQIKPDLEAAQNYLDKAKAVNNEQGGANNQQTLANTQNDQNTGNDGGTISSMETARGVGKPYGARDPRICSNTKTPTGGAISAAQATKYVICNQEGVSSDLLYLVENMRVEIGASRPYNYYSDSYATSIDTTAPVYPIRGSFDKYQCGVVSAYMENAGHNCTLYQQPKAEGKCYKTTFGDWNCNMVDTSNNDSDRKFKLPPPR